MNRTRGERGAALRAARGVRRDTWREAWRAIVAVLAGVGALTLAPAVARAQGAPPPVQQPPVQPPKRKALEIRGQAPAPEVVTVRPREVPDYTRRIIVPVLFDARPATPERRTVVLLPGPPPESAAGASQVPVKPPE